MGPIPGDLPGAALFGAALPVAVEYARLLSTDGVERGLLGPREVPRIWERHILNSTVIEAFVPQGAQVVDVGSGAGLPGIPLAILRQDVTVTLLEPLLRRTVFLSEAVQALGIADRVEIVRGRAEDHSRRYDVVTARAVAPMSRLVPWCRPLLRSAGSLVALKGSSAEEEVAAAKQILEELRLEASVRRLRPVPELDETTAVIVRQRDKSI
ncbi:MAG: 16S rRNA (guanine(527)-N(7))-methyltransferase RsmG [Propioniciclava sp.]